MTLELFLAFNRVHFGEFVKSHEESDGRYLPIALFVLFLWLAPSTLFGQIYGGFGGNGIYAPSGLSAGISPYAMSRYSLGNPYIGQLLSSGELTALGAQVCPFPGQPGYGYPFYGKSSYSYVTPYGGYGLSGYEANCWEVGFDFFNHLGSTLWREHLLATGRCLPANALWPRLWGSKVRMDR